jgi:hypothetical protein
MGSKLPRLEQWSQAKFLDFDFLESAFNPRTTLNPIWPKHTVSGKMTDANTKQHSKVKKWRVQTLNICFFAKQLFASRNNKLDLQC